MSFLEKLAGVIQKNKSLLCVGLDPAPALMPDKIGIFESNRGIHIHLFYDIMFIMNDSWRKKFRTEMIKKYQADLHKISERVTINLEFAEHWKSGKIKGLLKGNILENER